jgi:hypothetical protein
MDFPGAIIFLALWSLAATLVTIDMLRGKRG